MLQGYSQGGIPMDQGSLILNDRARKLVFLESLRKIEGFYVKPHSIVQTITKNLYFLYTVIAVVGYGTICPIPNSLV